MQLTKRKSHNWTLLKANHQIFRNPATKIVAWALSVCSYWCAIELNMRLHVVAIKLMTQMIWFLHEAVAFGNIWWYLHWFSLEFNFTHENCMLVCWHISTFHGLNSKGNWHRYHQIIRNPTVLCENRSLSALSLFLLMCNRIEYPIECCCNWTNDANVMVFAESSSKYLVVSVSISFRVQWMRRSSVSAIQHTIPWIKLNSVQAPPEISQSNNSIQKY